MARRTALPPVPLLLALPLIVALSVTALPRYTKEGIRCTDYVYSALAYFDGDDDGGVTTFWISPKTGGPAGLNVSLNVTYGPNNPGFGVLDNGKTVFFIIADGLMMVDSSTGKNLSMPSISMPQDLALAYDPGTNCLYYCDSDVAMGYLSLKTLELTDLGANHDFNSFFNMVMDVSVPDNAMFIGLTNALIALDMSSGRLLGAVQDFAVMGIFHDDLTGTTYAFFHWTRLVQVDWRTNSSKVLHDFQVEWGPGSFMQGAAYDKAQGIVYGAYARGVGGEGYYFFTYDLRNRKLLHSVLMEKSLIPSTGILHMGFACTQKLMFD